MSGNKIMFIGGANVDITGIPDNSFSENDKNYGTVLVSAGGVARNIAANVSMLGETPSLLSVICDDALSNSVIKSCKKLNIDISHSLHLENCVTPAYMSITDANNNPRYAISDMKLYNKITPEFLETKLSIINDCSLCVMDGNFSSSAIKYIVDNVSVPVFIDPTSTTHSLKFKNYIGAFHTITPNLDEAKALSGITISSSDDFEKLKNYFLNEGVKRIFITLGEDGVYYSDENTSGFLKHKAENIKSTNGAGDSFMAGIVYAYINDYNIEDCGKYGVATARVSLNSYSAVNENLSLEKANKIFKELK